MFADNSQAEVGEMMITILMGTYNGAKFIAEQIESILSQTEKDWKLIISDDCSTDATASIVSKYAEAYQDKMTFIVRDKPSGSAKNNFIHMLSLYESEYIMTCDQDDVWLPTKIELTMKKMREMEDKFGKEKPLLVHTDLKIVDANLKVMADSMFEYQNLDSGCSALNNLIVQNIVTGCTMMINRCLLDWIRDVPEESIMHDWWLAITASAFGHIGFVKEPTVLYRQHSNNEVGAKSAKSLSYNLQRLMELRKSELTLRKTYEQAKAFLDIYEQNLSVEQSVMIKAYTSLTTYGKLKRIYLINKYDFWKIGFARRCGQIFFI
ncbi:glycosyltransferase family 2 protein [Desulfitobacterium hafniense]|nr:glycosyltransferase family 2 protein [Desulfitobacterium hafniense]